MDPLTIILHPKELFDKHSRNEKFDDLKQLFGSKMSEGSSARAHCLKMINWTEKLGQLRFAMDHELNVDLMLSFLPDSFSQFVINFKMNQLEVSLPTLLNMLDTIEKFIKRDMFVVLLDSST